ncbi:MAG: hypothetical protein WBM40_24535 [Thiohalocapsa sp.]
MDLVANVIMLHDFHDLTEAFADMEVVPTSLALRTLRSLAEILGPC